jgi:2-hydroxy-3-oxopropionate reductase
VTESTARAAPTGETIGFVGLGVMGAPMALHLLEAGLPLVVHNRSPAAAETLRGSGADVAGSPRELAARTTIVVTMLPDTPDVSAVVDGADGLLAGASAGSLFIDMSTISPLVARRLAGKAAEQGVAMLDAPVSGGDVGAREATLSIMVGGESAAFERALPILELMGKTVVHVGDSGAGQVVKACNQIVVALTIEAVGEALVLGAKAGVAPEAIIEVLSGGLAASRVLDLRGRGMVAHTFTPGFRTELHHKDLGIALEMARAVGVSLPVTAIVDQMMGSLRQHGYGASDHSALITYVEQASGYSISP